VRPDLEWKITYVGSAEDSRHDQVLESVLVGPVAVGPYHFLFQARPRRYTRALSVAADAARVRGAQTNPPDWEAIPQDDLLGVTVLLLTCAYNGQEFIRVGYYVNNEYGDEALRENPPASIRIDKVVVRRQRAPPERGLTRPRRRLLQRTILADKPRITRFPGAPVRLECGYWWADFIDSSVDFDGYAPEEDQDAQLMMDAAEGGELLPLAEDDQAFDVVAPAGVAAAGLVGPT
jgi:histone chaperone ASF1